LHPAEVPTWNAIGNKPYTSQNKCENEATSENSGEHIEVVAHVELLKLFNITMQGNKKASVGRIRPLKESIVYLQIDYFYPYFQSLELL
jgi:hypothetical protein